MEKKLISDKFFQKNLKNDKVRLELEQVASFIEPPAEQVEGLTFFFFPSVCAPFGPIFEEWAHPLHGNEKTKNCVLNLNRGSFPLQNKSNGETIEL